MGRKLLLANLVILAGVIVLAQQLVQSWDEFQGIPAITPLEERGLDLEVPIAEPQPASLPQFLIIAERNLFTESRGNEPAPDALQAQTAPEFTVDPKLISVSSFGGVEEAVLEVFEGRRGQQSERQVVKVGDDVGGYYVAAIESDRLTLAWNEVRKEINLEASRPQPRQQARTAAGVNIITVGTAVAAVETTTPAAEEEAARGLEVGVVSAPQTRGGMQGRGGAAGLRGGARGQQQGLGAGSRRGFQNNQRAPEAMPGIVGVGPGQPTQNPPPQ